MSFCTMRNFGMVTPMSKLMTAITATTASTMIHQSDSVLCTTMMMPPIAMMGA